MEHRLITGGAEFLPFARSCVAKLKKLGVAYANQSYEVDGVSIKVRIEPGHEYIRLEGGETAIPMDTGVVDVFRDDEFYASAFSAGVLYPTTSTEPGVAGFAPTAPPGEFLSKKFAKENGSIQFPVYGVAVTDGKPGIQGYIPSQDPTPAMSFSPLKFTRANPDGVSSVETRPDDHDLVAKKHVAVVCPASIFTGKTRLWVQAMYGLHMYKYKDWRTPGSQPEGVDPPVGVSLGVIETAPPILTVPMHRADKTAPAKTMYVTTSTGVILLPDNTHWVCTVNPTFAEFAPLKPSPAGISLRKYLRDSSGAVHADIEAYILAESVPDYDRIQVVTLAGNHTNFSMGYGWHWNWSGTAADIVVNDDAYEYRPGRYAVESFHHRFTPSWSVSNGDTVWAGAISTVEGPNVWIARFNNCPVLWPTWYQYTLDRLMPALYAPEEVFDHDAPFYVFYVGDEIQVCRSKRSTVAATSRIDMTPGYDPALPSGPNVVGLRDGHYASYACNPYYPSSYSAGATAVQVDLGRYESGMKEKTYGAAWDGIATFGGWYAAGGTVKNGYPPYDLVDYPWANQNVPLPPDYQPNYPYTYTGMRAQTDTTAGRVLLTHERNFTSLSYGGNIKSMVPKYDSQALYLSRGYSLETIESARDVDHVASTQLMQMRQYVIGTSMDPQTMTWYVYGPGRGNEFISTSTEPDTYDLTQEFKNTYVGSAGIFDAGSVDFAGHYGDVSYTGSPVYEAWSSATPSHGASGYRLPSPPIVYGTVGILAPKNFTWSVTSPQHNPVFVGWV